MLLIVNVVPQRKIGGKVLKKPKKDAKAGEKYDEILFHNTLLV